MLIPAPRNGRDLLEALRLYDAELGIAKFLDRLELGRMTPRQTVFCVFGRLASAQGARVLPHYDPRRHLRNLLLGEEFQKRLMARMLECYPEKKRLVFVHVPKCAGSDLTSILVEHHPAFNFRLTDRVWTSAEKMLAAIKNLVDELAYAGDVFVHGHIPLRQHISNELIRFGDEVFSIVRNPLDMIVSTINYMLGRLTDDRELRRVDTRDWLRLISHEKLKAAISSGDYRDIALEMLFSPKLIQSNPICDFLGERTARSAFDLCARADVEITHVDRYEEWLRLRWGAVSRRNNASRPIVSLSTLGADGLRRAESITEEDRVFVSQVERKMQEDNRCLVMGTQLGG